ncbi:MAG: response regulator transcription factor [Bacteroidales bacterium]|nr:response regulator transcription factor [Bacteroidales bacterium]
MSTEKISDIIVADSQFLVVETLKSLIQQDSRYRLAGVARTQDELSRVLKGITDGLLIIDAANLGFSEIDDLKQIGQKHPLLSFLILTNSISKTTFTGLTRLGIRNILYKTADKNDLLGAMESAIKGKAYYSDEVLDLCLDFGKTSYLVEESKQLTASEIDIVKLIASGLTTKEIASKRHSSYHTVNTHRKNIFRKVEVSNASELIIHAIKSGWIDHIEYYI